MSAQFTIFTRITSTYAISMWETYKEYHKDHKNKNNNKKKKELKQYSKDKIQKSANPPLPTFIFPEYYMLFSARCEVISFHSTETQMENFPFGSLGRKNLKENGGNEKVRRKFIRPVCNTACRRTAQNIKDK